jgi:hypothetical protein
MGVLPVVRPIDLQDNLSKAPLAGRLQQIQQDTAEMAHRQVARETAQQQVADRSRPLPADESRRSEVHPDGGGKESRGKKRGKQRKDTSQKASESAADKGGDTHHIDIVA